MVLDNSTKSIETHVNTTIRQTAVAVIHDCRT